jgi:hypothetical protein
MVQLTWEKNTNVENYRYLTSEKQKVERNNVTLTKRGTRSAHTL